MAQCSFNQNKTCVQKIAAICCNFGVRGHRHIEVATAESRVLTYRVILVPGIFCAIQIYNRRSTIGYFLDPLNSWKPKHGWYKNSNQEMIKCPFLFKSGRFCRAIGRGHKMIVRGDFVKYQILQCLFWNRVQKTQLPRGDEKTTWNLWWYSKILQQLHRTAKRCNTLQHTATRCNV